LRRIFFTNNGKSIYFQTFMRRWNIKKKIRITKRGSCLRG
jgi:hypothetical protein